MSSVSEFVTYSCSDQGIALITLRRPEKLNAMTREMYEEISGYLRQVDEDPDVRVGIVTGGEGRAFSAGADLVAVHAGTADKRRRWEARRPRRFDSGLEVQKPLIAAVEGYCLAGGMELALFCDIRIAGQGATFGAPEVKWNLLHGYGAQVLPGIIGSANAAYLLLTGTFIDAARAERLGLVQEVVEDGTALARAEELASLIAGHAPMAVRMTKELLHHGRSSVLAEGLSHYQALNRIIHVSEDLEAGVGAFAEGRAPSFNDN
jgi:enoyl-CoA hydratase/carnithine racemase